ncbi:FtsW/RodA/SpoVE family cell cycle protein [Erysipelothrix sp. HDW6C]|uniref:FtsW/RodA/SpoVE family cell cycle protein n=1 Tax=Erysipelothrix sp. HDW6C TaxID=2714930 RepID=UPI00140A8FA4|nr:FtsW/RodA/SpoVE family cell cycle protein [Erysipelothrix sp. HDW6C]QIK70322.1 FtsW/RodA/SpoVE family cell cycle protein [Erysipelothrix sp. HDW6C]
MKKKKLSLKMPAGYNRYIHAAVLILNLFGVLMIISASMKADANIGSLMFIGAKEMGFVVVSYVGMVFTARMFNFKWAQKYSRIITGGIIVMLLLPILMGYSAGGARAWISIGPITIQPSEFAKVWIIILIALRLGDKDRVRIAKMRDLITEPLAIVMVMVFIVTILQKDLGSAVVILGISYICFLVPSNRRLTRLQQVMMILMLIGVIFLIILDTEGGLAFISKTLESMGVHPYMLGRLQSSANPFADRYGDGYQLFMGLVAMVQGLESGFFGKGYGNSVNKYGYLPEAQTDFILAIVVEELGVFGILVIVIGYGTVLYNTLKYSILVKLERDKILLIGAASYIMIHFIFNVGGVTGLIPLTGVPLLFISAGDQVVSRLCWRLDWSKMLSVVITSNRKCSSKRKSWRSNHENCSRNARFTCFKNPKREYHTPNI